jgi:outer membrane protein assembly factor BamB
MPTIFCPQCGEVILNEAACLACNWRRPPEARVADAESWRVELGRRLTRRCYPVIAAGHYCVATEDGAVVALDLESGRPAWERMLGEGRASHALATDGHRLFVGCVDTHPLPTPGKPFLALDARTGEQAWMYPTGAHSLSAAAVDGDTIYFMSSDRLIHAVDAATGQKRWAVKHPTWGPAAPAADAGMVCAGGRAESLVAYSAADGAQLWRFTAGDGFADELAIADGRVYAPCADGNLYVLDAGGGRLLWKLKAERGKGITTSPLVAGGQVFIGSRVYREADAEPRAGYALLALRAEDGAEVWRCYTERHIFAPPAVAGDTLLFVSDDGLFYALDVASGAERWRAQLEGRVVTEPQVGGDLVYIGERHGIAYAIRWREKPAEELLPPGIHKQQGEYEKAAIAQALCGELDEAAAIYETELRQHREAALLYERAGQLGKAASLWDELGELRRARDCYREAGDILRLADVLERLGEPLEAARLHEKIGNFAEAARLYEQSGDRVRAAELYDQLGRFGQARAIWESLGEWERSVNDLIAEAQLVEAARILEQHNQLERAAGLYEEAKQFQQALAVRVRLEHWERVAALAFQIGDYEQAAAAHVQLGQAQPAAEAYEWAAQHAIATEPRDEERIARLYERAAQLYDDLSEDERAAACQREVQRYRHLPKVIVSEEAHEAVVEHEWNALALRVENTGYGPARNVTIALRGAFEVAGDLRFGTLSPKKLVSREISMRPHREEFGPKVPLEIAVTYQDARGGRYEATQHIFIRVVKRISPPTPPDPTPDREEDIAQQQQLLAAHRRTLAHYLMQQAALGTANTPPAVTHGIREARDNIRRIKQFLRDRGVAVANHPDDEPPAD